MTREHFKHQQSPVTFWVGFILGGLIAAVAVFLMGTQKGRQTLEEALEKMEEYEGKVEDTVAIMQEKSDEILQKVQEVKESVVDQIEAKKDVVSEAITSQLDSALSTIEDVQRKSFTKDGKRLTS